MHCEICNKYIFNDSQYINGKYYHNSCIEKLVQENQKLKNNWNDLKKYLLGSISSNNIFITENSMLSKMQEIEKSDK